MEQKYLTSGAYLMALGQRIKQYRVDCQLTQKELADKSGVSLRSLQNLEGGADMQLGNFIKILLALDCADKLDLLIPDMSTRPSAYLKKQKLSSRVRHTKNAPSEPFIWGDEK